MTLGIWSLYRKKEMEKQNIIRAQLGCSFPILCAFM